MTVPSSNLLWVRHLETKTEVGRRRLAQRFRSGIGTKLTPFDTTMSAFDPKRTYRNSNYWWPTGHTRIRFNNKKALR